MERLELYRAIIRDMIQKYAAYRPARGEIQIEVADQI
ncbi:MAG: hypothetical protein GFH27_549285n287 [Chloroflexi bacterium AL-W]|nr:hypothetical protein [Chloroflexi bacterium AL-N1]NOK65799.1 hypothetical protein [Chloroflexi bacterium AL-N10]NOK74260.1 hypothetical protein [Chloroflexi bacterium AL-N5]NOK80832.1 hypothetical protein [Chloroflexi bacterium AL-W]NOK88518.1 hypothetical protein [Chloroflexi bacterium AL-N15]